MLRVRQNILRWHTGPLVISPHSRVKARTRRPELQFISRLTPILQSGGQTGHQMRHGVWGFWHARAVVRNCDMGTAVEWATDWESKLMPMSP